MHGINTLEAEVTNISKHGFWLFITGSEYFLPYTSFPWFRKATIEEISTLEFLHKTHLYWPLLDIDLHLDAIINPENYPLIDKER